MDVVRAMNASASRARNLSSPSTRGKMSSRNPCGLWIAKKSIHRDEKMMRRKNVEVEARGPSKSCIDSLECSQDTGSLVLLAGYVSWWKVYVAWMGTVVSLSALLIAVPQFGKVGGLLGQGDLVGLSRHAAILSLALLVRAVAQYVQDTLLWEVAAGVTRRIRQTVFSRLQGADIRTFETQGSSTGTEVDGYEVGDLTYRLTAEAEKAGEMSFAALQRLIPGLLQLIAMLVRMLVTSPLLTGCTLFVAPVMGAAIAGIGNLVRKQSKDTQAATAALSSYLAEIFPAMHIVRTHGGEHHEEARFHTLTEACESTKIRAERVRMVLPAAMTIIYTVTVLVLFFAGCWAINQGQISGEDMISFLSAVVLLVEPIQGCSIAYNELRQGEAAVERLLSLLHVQKSSVFAFHQKEEDEKLETDNEVLVPNQALAVSTHGLSYRYRNALRDALCKVCITVEPGQCAWIVGASGSGKSTLAKLLLGLYKPTSGYICLGQERICDMNEAKFRSLVGYVPQDSRLLNGTVADNISYAMAKDPQRIHEVAETSRVNVFLDVASNGYMTPVGASGSSLSGGQKQRVAIARALYRNPRVLVLDEATSSLDSTTASDLRAQLALAIEGITTIVVAHRLDGAELADVIYVLEEGNVVESGTHAQLIERGGLYRDLWYDSRSGTSSEWSVQESA